MWLETKTQLTADKTDGRWQASAIFPGTSIGGRAVHRHSSVATGWRTGRRSGLDLMASLRVVNRTINDMIIYGRPDRASAARRLS
jgi:hypothetical protein